MKLTTKSAMKSEILAKDLEEMISVQRSDNQKKLEKQKTMLVLAFLFGSLLISIPFNIYLYQYFAKHQNDHNEANTNLSNHAISTYQIETKLFHNSIDPLIDHRIPPMKKYAAIFQERVDTMCALPDAQKFDCDPNPNTTQTQCLSLGCCWVESVKKQGTSVGKPSCYFPINYVGYEITDNKKTDTGLQLELTRRASSSFQDVQKLLVTIVEINANTLTVKITKEQGPEKLALPRPLKFVHKNKQKKSFLRDNSNVYTYSVVNGTLTILRNLDQTLIWSANLQTLIFAENQFRQIDTQVTQFLSNSTASLYGLGEHMDHYEKTQFNYTRYTFSNRGRNPTWMLNSYGTHPMYLITEQDSRAHFTLFSNTYPSEAILRPGPGITWRAIGGDLYFVFNLENDVILAISSYATMVGNPFLPPVWSLGFHLSRYGYNSLNETRATYQRMRNALIPYDTQWHDIDAMDSFNDFTYDPINFKGLPDFVQELHNNNMQYVPIVDPGLDGIYLNGTKYPGFDLDAIVQNQDGSPLRAQVWNQNWTAWIDFTSQKGQQLWMNQIASYHAEVPFDGLWIDMNEPANLVNGSIDGCLNSSSYDHPPYIPGDELDPIYEHTACMSAKHAAGSHYQVHNTYGHWEASVTYNGLQKLNKRPFVLSRSSYVGTGAYSAHWTGDIQSTWEYMKQSIVGILEFNLFGIPLVGADICGFHGNTSIELCTRWHQLGSFYPFSRNHNDKETISQDPPSLGPTVVQAAKNALELRYQLHNLLYSAFYAANLGGIPVVWSLMMYAPTDKVARSIETQFMWSNQLMIIPVLEEGATQVNAYFPAGIWYDFPSLTQLVSNNQNGSWLELNAPLNTIRLAVPGGSVLVCQKPEVTIAETRKNPLEIIVFLDESGQANSFLYWDDGKSVDVVNFNFVTYNLIENRFHVIPLQANYDLQPITSNVTFVGLSQNPQNVYLNNETAPFEWNSNDKILSVIVNQTYSQTYDISWD